LIHTDALLGEGQLVQLVEPPQAAESIQWQNGQQIEYFKLKKKGLPELTGKSIDNCTSGSG
jgi:hypothetical protein